MCGRHPCGTHCAVRQLKHLPDAVFAAPTGYLSGNAVGRILAALEAPVTLVRHPDAVRDTLLCTRWATTDGMVSRTEIAEVLTGTRQLPKAVTPDGAAW